MNQKINTSLKNAFEMLRMAETELYRPHKDSVTLCACQCTRNSACEFFRSFLMSKSFDQFENYSLADLQHQCAEFDSHFNSIDLSCFGCKNGDSDSCEKNYCLSVEKVNQCFERTNEIRQLLVEKLELTEKDFA